MTLPLRVPVMVLSMSMKIPVIIPEMSLPVMIPLMLLPVMIPLIPLPVMIPLMLLPVMKPLPAILFLQRAQMKQWLCQWRPSKLMKRVPPCPVMGSWHAAHLGVRLTENIVALVAPQMYIWT